MTPAALRARLHALSPDRPWPDDPGDLASAVDAASSEHPGDPAWTALLLDAELLRTADVPLPQGLRRGALVRADAVSATWTATDADGSHVLVRAPRPSAAPLALRVLERDRAVLAGLVAGVHLREGALVAPAPGIPVDEAVPPASDLARLLASAVDGAVAVERAGLGLDPAPAEVRVDRGRAVLVGLTPASGGAGPVLGRIAARLVAPGAVGRFVDGLRELPPERVDGLQDALRRAFAEDLAERALSLRRGSLVAGHGRRRAGLLRAVAALEASVPPPDGRGLVGYDLDGRATVLSCADRIVRFGTEDADGDVIWDASGFRAPEARRLLRALAVAPVGSAAQARAGGSQAFTDAMGRWVSAGLKLRTVRLLLEKA